MQRRSAIRFMLTKLAIPMAFWFTLTTPSFGSDQWTAPTAEELAMTSIALVPGAPAVYLYREEVTADQYHSVETYVRIKILSDGGKGYADVELPLGGEANVRFDNIAGRTIHRDGTVIPFTGKPFEKVVEKIQGYKLKVKVFSLPSIEVGSIVEYRYRAVYDEAFYLSPDWFIQSDLFTLKAHYAWEPTEQVLVDDESGGRMAGIIAWAPLLPEGATVHPPAKLVGRRFTLDVQNIPPLPKEEMMPPIESISYRVQFYHTPFKSEDDYWKFIGEDWSKARDKFIGPDQALRAAVAGTVSATDSDEQKLRKIYATVMALENTDLTRQRSTREDRMQGYRETTAVDDILARRRGNGDQLTELFVAMARAAGLKAYLAGVSNRNERVFLRMYLSLHQLDDYIAIVEVGGKEVYFDPGQRYCTFGHLAWFHTVSGGLRQTAKGTATFETPAESYRDSRIDRIADLQLDDSGAAQGTVTLSYTGAPAMRWRQDAIRGDRISLNEGLRTNLEKMLPGGMEIQVTQIDNLTDPDQPLVVRYHVAGAVGSATAKRLLLPADIFESRTTPLFPDAKREVQIDMHYPRATQDAVRFSFPRTLTVESAPNPEKQVLGQTALFTTSAKLAPGSVTLHHNVTEGATIYAVSDYADVREFYQKLGAKDQETVVLTRADRGAKPTGVGN